MLNQNSVLKENNKNVSYYCIALFFVLLSVFLHLYKLDSIPHSLNVDEAGLWYNVKCLLNYGTDQKGNTWPILFANLWGEQSPAYIYLAFICCKIFGDTLFAIRLPSVINTLIIMIFGEKIVNLIFKDKRINLLFLILYTITPYFTIISKMALDCNLMLGFSTVFLYFFLKAVESNSTKYFLVSGIICGLTFYTYALSYLMIPLFLIFSLIYLFYFKKITIKNIMIFAIPAFILGLPLLMIQIINIFDLNEISVLMVTFPKFDTNRGGEFSCNIGNILFNLVLAIIFIFKALEKSIYNIPVGYLYYISSILILIGWGLTIKEFIISIKEKSFKYVNFMLFWAISIIITLLFLNKGRDLYQQCAIYISYMIFLINSFVHIFHKINNKKIARIIALVISVIYFVSFVLFLQFYFVQYDEFASETKLMAAEVPTEINELEGTTYFLKSYAYYQATYGVLPSEFRTEQTGPFVYNNIVFNFYFYPDTPVDTKCNYVIYYKDFDTMQYFNKDDFKISRIGDYLFYLSRTTQ